MAIQISKKEEKEIVTKGFLVTYLKSQKYITQDYFDTKMIEFYEQSDARMQHFLQVALENNQDTLTKLIEAFESRFESVERRVGVLESKI